jgi:hypothetical protein
MKIGTRQQALGNRKKFGPRKKKMIKTLLNRFLVSSSFNRKSKPCGERRRTIQNLKLVELVAVAFALWLNPLWSVAARPMKTGTSPDKRNPCTAMVDALAEASY